MILTVTPNAALDLTYDVAGVEWDGTNRVRSVHARAGGKGVNVARTLACLGADVAATGFCGGPTGAALLADLADSAGAGAVEARFCEIAGDSRRTLAVVDSARGSATMFTEPGPAVSGAEAAALVAMVADLAARADAVVLAGSLPPGVPPDFYATLAAISQERASHVPVYLDADGEALRRGVAGLPAVVTPNAAELALATGTDAVRAGALELTAMGAGAVVVTLGEEGAVAFAEGRVWHAVAPRVSGNPTGAGDALVAGLAAAADFDWPERLALAVAMSGAAVAAPLAGDIDTDEYVRLYPLVQVRTLTEDDHAPLSAW